MAHFEKRRWIVPAVAIVWLVGCFVVGQLMVGVPASSHVDAEQVEGKATSNGENLLAYAIDFHGVQEVSKDENPWGFTAGEITLEDGTTAWLLTPGTSLTMGAARNVELEYYIHPWVASKSDGASVQVEVGGQTTELQVSSDHQTYRVPEGVDSLRATALSSNNEDGDWVVICARNVTNRMFGNDGYVESATYFGNEWPVNFWNSEADGVVSDFEQIRSDGFDSVLFVLPWREFQPSMSPTTYNDYCFKKLDDLMGAAEASGLGVYVRIGYTWDFFEDDSGPSSERFLTVFSDEVTRQAWLSYAEELYNRLSAYAAFRGGFITWEDFWGIIKLCRVESEANRIVYAREVGFREWVTNNFARIDDYNHLYGTEYTSFDTVPIPRADEPAMECLYRFFDEKLMQLLEETQNLSFPNLSCEVRLDADRIANLDGQTRLFSHERTYGCGSSSFTSAMYGIPMGFENKGETVTAKDAVEHTAYVLEHLASQNSGKFVYVDQFIFTDNTPEFSDNARLKDAEVNSYLDAVAAPLKEHTVGFGIWTYRDYRNNMLYNNGFELSGSGWTGMQNVGFEKVNGSMSCHLGSGASISQAVAETRNPFDSESYVLSFDVVRMSEKGSLQTSVGSVSSTISVDHEGTYQVSYPKSDSFDVALSLSSGDMCVDNICLYTHIQEGLLYDVDGKPLSALEGIRSLNAQLG